MARRAWQRLLARAGARSDRRFVPEARPAVADSEPGDVHRRARQRDHDGDLLPRSCPWRDERPLVRRVDRGLALADRAVRELRRSDRRGARQGPGQRAARDEHDDECDPARRAVGPRGRTAARRRRGRRGRRHHPRRRRDHRGRRLGRRVGDHRRVGAGHPRVRRRPLGRHGWHEAALRPPRDRGDAGARQVVSRPDDRTRRGRRAPQDAERDRAQHPALGSDDHLRRGGRDLAPVCDLCGHADVADRPDRVARRADPDDDRRSALRDRDRRHGPTRAAERACDVGARRRGVG